MREKSLSENTLIPLSAISIIGGAIVWITTIYAQGTTNAKEITEVKQTQAIQADDLIQIKADVSFIRGFLEKGKKHAPDDM